MSMATPSNVTLSPFAGSHMSGESSIGPSSCSEGETASSLSSTTKPSRRERKSNESRNVVVTPWYPQGMSKSKLKLNDELRALHEMLQLSPVETSRRHMMRSGIQEIVARVWPEATVKVYGSFAYGLSLPHSPVDLVCEDCGDFNEFDEVLRHLIEAGYDIEASSCSYESAFFRVTAHGATANVSLVAGRSSARKSVAEMRNLIAQFPSVAPVFAAVRLVLQQSRCGDIAQGGLPSYAALVMILHAAYISKKPDCPAHLLIDFFKFYGAAAGPMTEPIFVEDPLCSDNDLAAGCHRMPQIRAMFQNCAMTLEKWNTSKWDGYRGRTPLSSILAHDGLWVRKQ